MYVAYLEYKAKWHNVTSKNMANLKKRKKYINGVFAKEKNWIGADCTVDAFDFWTE